MYKLDKDEQIIYSQKKSLWTKLICPLVIIGSAYLALIVTFNTDQNLNFWFMDIIFLPLGYGMFYFLISKVIVTNKRIFYKNYLYITQTINLNEILYIVILNSPYFLTDLGIIGFKTRNKSLIRYFPVPDEFKFRDKVIEYIKNQLVNNNLNQDLMRMDFWYKLGAIR